MFALNIFSLKLCIMLVAKHKSQPFLVIYYFCKASSQRSYSSILHRFRHFRQDPNESCLFAAGSPTDTVGSQIFRTLSTRQIAFWWLSGRCRQCYIDFLLLCAGNIEADHTDSGIAMDCADRNRETPHLGD